MIPIPARLQPAAIAAHTLVKSVGPRARTRHRLADRHLHGSGLEIGALHLPLRTAADVTYVDRYSRADLRREYPELRALPVVDPDVVDDGERLTTIPDGSQDFIVANHFIEHCEDPIGTLATFARRIRPGGAVYLAVPDKRFTFDSERPSTPWEHLVQDHADGGEASRTDHYLEFSRFVSFEGRGGDAEVAAKAAEMEAARFSIHFHVWTTDEFADVVRRVHETAVPELELAEVVRNGDESLFVLHRG